MITIREQLLKIIDEIPENELEKLLDFVEYIRDKIENKAFYDLAKASESS